MPPVTYTPSAQAVAATSLLNTNLTTCPSPGPFTGTTATGATALPFQCVVDAIIPVITNPTNGPWHAPVFKAADFTVATWTQTTVSLSAGDVTATLPDPTASGIIGSQLIITIHPAGNTLTITTPAGTISGNPSVTSAADWATFYFASNGVDWVVS